MNEPLDPIAHRELLRAALPEATDADTLAPTLPTLFTPDTHRVALAPDVSVVRAGRGAGKTVWFSALLDPRLREAAAESYDMPQVRRIRPFRGFGAQIAPDSYPGWRTLDQLLRERPGRGDGTEQIWDAVLLTALGCPEIRGTSWKRKVAWVRDNPEARDRTLRAADREAETSGQTVLLLFDALDRLHPCRRTADTVAAGILRLALDLRLGTRNLRAKVFIRPDMFSGVQLRFPDASKLTGNAADLTWTSTNLYGLLFHRLGNADGPRAEEFRGRFPEWRPSDASGNRFLPPSDLVADHRRQKVLFEALAGPYMGAGHRKGHTYTWLPNHLVDGLGQVSPRSFLSALREAVSTTGTEYTGHPFALHHEGIRRGVQQASRIRVDEIAEDIPWVVDAVRALEGMQVPAEARDIEDRWRQRDLESTLRRTSRDPVPPEGGQEAGTDDGEVRAGPRDPGDPRALIEELRELGVMRTRADGRLDLPDVYRIAFGLGRRGGVPRLPRR